MNKNNQNQDFVVVIDSVESRPYGLDLSFLDINPFKPSGLSPTGDWLSLHGPKEASKERAFKRCARHDCAAGRFSAWKVFVSIRRVVVAPSRLLCINVGTRLFVFLYPLRIQVLMCFKNKTEK